MMKRKKESRKTKTSGLSSFISQNRKVLAILLVILIPVMGIVAVVTAGGVFAPTAPPSEFATGYARIYLVDGMTGQWISSNKVHLIAVNNTIWKSNQGTGITFYVPTASVWWVNVSGYYPVSGTLFASGGTEPSGYLNNTMNVFARADPSSIRVELYRWKNMTSGSYNYSGVFPDLKGLYEIDIRMSIDAPFRSNSTFGFSEWVPPVLISTKTFAYNLSLPFVSLWFGWNASISYYTIVNTPYWGFNDVYDINILNCTMLPACIGEATYTIRANFSTPIQSLRIYDGLIDNYTRYISEIF